MAAKKQVFARALKRVNYRLDSLLANEKRAAMRAGMTAALERKRRAPCTIRRAAVARAAERSRSKIPRAHDIVPPATVGSISQAGRVAQARRDKKEKK